MHTKKYRKRHGAVFVAAALATMFAFVVLIGLGLAAPPNLSVNTSDAYMMTADGSPDPAPVAVANNNTVSIVNGNSNFETGVYDAILPTNGRQNGFASVSRVNDTANTTSAEHKLNPTMLNNAKSELKEVKGDVILPNANRLIGIDAILIST